MHLANVPGLRIHGLEPGKKRVVAYCENQDAPWFISGEIEPKDGCLEACIPDSIPRAIGRSTKIALRVFEGEKVILEEIVDLRHPSKGQVVIIGCPSNMNGAQQRPVTSLSYDTVVSIWVLQNSLDDANDTRESLEPEISRLWPGSRLELMDHITSLQRRLQRTTRSTEQIRKSTKAIRNEITTTRERNKCIRSELEKNTNTELVADKGPVQPEILEEKQHELALVFEHQRLAKQIMEIFPIEPVDSSFHFTICGIFLPNVFAISQFDPVQVGAALGLVAQVVLSLSFYLDVALPYPIRAFGSQSFIVDNISKIKGSRTFPLWTKGALLYRVEYGLFLLHKDIEQLMTAQGLPVVDLKQTLANLKNLLLVVSS